MTGYGVSDGDMPNFPGRSRRDVPVIGDASLAALLAGGESPAPELRPVAEALAALRAGPAGDELAGEAVALAAFRDHIGVPGPARHPARQPARGPARRRSALLSPLLSARAAVIAAALSLAGFATAAYAGALPVPVQQLAHAAIGAPAPGGGTSVRSQHASGGPSPAGHAAYGLCTAWVHAKAHGTSKQQAVAFRNLAAVVGGAGKVAAYCAAVPHPGALSSHQPHPAPTPHGHGKPSGHPTPHGDGKPTTHP